jgi:PAP2 superfamily
MKANRILSVMIISLMLYVSGCQEIEQVEDLKPLDLADVDADAGTWSIIPNSLITSVNQFAVAAPAATNSATYLAELEVIKDAQSKLTQAQKDVIKYWSGGGVLRWNQILRKLVAQYALPPAPRADGSYVFPDAENPFADPAFPFANPPYSARAYSFVSIAQYEALKTTWYYKYLGTHVRTAPFKNNSEIKLLVPANELNDHAYPSEDAVLSGVTAEMLKVLFPGAVEEITKMAAEQRNAALWSGKASSSDISAGLSLGKAVAGFIIAPGTGRFRTDNMGGSVGTKAQWDDLINVAKQHYTDIADPRDLTTEVFWKSLDGPSRPPMLPFFGNVKGWFLSPAQFATERTAIGPPPSTGSDQMKEELAELKRVTDKVDREKLRIVHFWADGAGTYTPPGHWNDIATEYISKSNFSEVRAARALAYLNAAMHDAAVGCWGVKYYWFNPRPSQMDASIKTVTGLPNFPSYTSGHSTFSAAAAEVLSYLFPGNASTFSTYLDEASISRLYGGIHYRSDIEKGKAHGAAIGGYTVTFASGDGADN